MSVTRDDILAAIKAETGDPSTGPIHDATPAIADAIDRLLNPKRVPIKNVKLVDFPDETAALPRPETR